MRGLHRDAEAWPFEMAGDHRLTGADLVVRRGLGDRDDRADVLYGDGVAPGRDGDQGIRGDPSLSRLRVVIRRAALERRQGFAGEAGGGARVRRAVAPLVRDRDAPLLEPGVQRVPRGEPATRQAIALDVLHAGLHLALGLCPVRLARPRREPVVTREIL